MKEIERKYLVCSDSYKHMATESRRIVQAYLSTSVRATIRVRISGEHAWITVKGCNNGCVRDEWEYPVPVDDALSMTCLAETPPLEKTRWYVPYGGFMWEIDEFSGPLDGLVVAEVELPDADTAAPLPDFIGREVTGDPRYYNSVLSSASELPPTC